MGLVAILLVVAIAGTYAFRSKTSLAKQVAAMQGRQLTLYTWNDVARTLGVDDNAFTQDLEL